MKIHKCDKSKCEKTEAEEHPLSYSDILKEEDIYVSSYNKEERFITVTAPGNPRIVLFVNATSPADDTRVLQVANNFWPPFREKFKRLPNAKLIMEVVDE